MYQTIEEHQLFWLKISGWSLAHMLNSDFSVLDIEGFRHNSQELITKKISVRGANYQDTIFFQPQVKFSLLAEENKNTNAWLTENLHGIVW